MWSPNVYAMLCYHFLITTVLPPPYACLLDMVVTILCRITAFNTLYKMYVNRSFYAHLITFASLLGSDEELLKKSEVISGIIPLLCPSLEILTYDRRYAYQLSKANILFSE